VVEHLVAKNHDGRAESLGHRVNSAGHTDLVVVSSPIFGLIHVTAIGGVSPNAPIPFRGEGADQGWLADKALVAFGWVDIDKRTLIFFVNVQVVRETPGLTRAIVRDKCKRELTAVLMPQ